MVLSPEKIRSFSRKKTWRIFLRWTILIMTISKRQCRVLGNVEWKAPQAYEDELGDRESTSW